MFNKKLCEKCNKKRNYWDKLDDIRWHQGIVFCPEVNILISIILETPDTCPYILEHLVNEENVHAQ